MILKNIDERYEKKIEDLKETIKKMADHIMFSSNYSRVCVDCEFYKLIICGPKKTNNCIIKYFKGENK